MPHQKPLKTANMFIPSTQRNLGVKQRGLRSRGAHLSFNTGARTVIKKEYVRISPLPLIQTSHLTSPRKPDFFSVHRDISRICNSLSTFLHDRTDPSYSSELHRGGPSSRCLTICIFKHLETEYARRLFLSLFTLLCYRPCQEIFKRALARNISPVYYPINPHEPSAIQLQDYCSPEQKKHTATNGSFLLSNTTRLFFFSFLCVFRLMWRSSQSTFPPTAPAVALPFPFLDCG